MKIGIIVAMGKELSLMLPLLDNAKSVAANGYELHTGNIGLHEVAVMQCGIGKVNAAIGTLSLIDAFAPELVINTGVAGGTGGRAGILSVVAADRVAYHDVWCGPGTEWGEAAGCPRFFTAAECVASLPCLAEANGVIHGLIASGDIFVSRPEEVMAIKSLYPDADAVDMESGAIAQTCHLKNVPFFCLRVISDTPGAADNISQYCNFWNDAPAHTFSLIKSMLAELPA